MKTYIFVLTILPLLSCSQEDTSGIYLQEYEKYQSSIGNEIDNINEVVEDSINNLLDNYIERITPMSCTWCVTEGQVFEPVKEFCKAHPEGLTIVLDRALKGERLTWGFRALFKELHPSIYQNLLDESNIPMTGDEWQRKTNEYNLSFVILIEEYLKIM